MRPSAEGPREGAMETSSHAREGPETPQLPAQQAHHLQQQQQQQQQQQHFVRQEAAIDEALASACGILSELAPGSDLNGRRRAPPPFLSRARALLFYHAVKTGFGLAVEHGTGIVVARLDEPVDAAAAAAADGEPPASPRPARWSAPCFVRVEGVSWGFVAGIDRVRGVIGLLTDEAVGALAQGSYRVTAGTEWNWALGRGGSTNRDMLANTDIAQVTVAKGMMIDICLKAGLLMVDSHKNQEVYGRGICAENLLRGQIEPPTGVQVLASAIRGAEGQVLAAAFEPSVHDSEGGSYG